MKQAILNPNNRLFAMARLGKRQPSALEALGVVVVILASILIPGQILARFLLRWIVPGGTQSVARPIVENLLGFLPVYLALWAWLRWSIRRPFRSVGLERPGALQKALRGALIAGLMMAATVGLAILPGASIEAGTLTSGAGALGIRLLSLATYLVQGPAEEVLFRGWLLPVIGSRYRPWIGVLVSSLVFSAVHAGSQGIARLGFLNLFLFGVFAAVYALSERGIWGIGVWHAVWNWSMGDLLGFALDGSPHPGLLLSIRTNDPDVLTGGTFGLEGGLAATAVFLIAIAVVVVRTRRDRDSWDEDSMLTEQSAT